jgi:integrase
MSTIETRAANDGTISYRAKVRMKGARPRSETFTRKTDARRWAQDTEADIRAGRHFKHSEAERRTVSELIDRYISQVLPRKPKTAPFQLRQLVWWRKHLGHLTLAQVTAARIVECREELLAGTTARRRLRAPATVNRYLAVLSHAFSIAVTEWEWLQDNPVLKLKKLREPRGRDRYLSESECERLLRACQESTNPYLYLVVVLAISTGMRHGEIITLRRRHVDVRRGRITLEETKNDEPRTVPLTGIAHSLLRKYLRVPRIDTDLLFPGTNPAKPVDLRKSWDNALRKAHISDFRFHDLRHTAASYLALSGASIKDIATILGHKSLAMANRYTHLPESHTEQVVAKMNARVFGRG